MRSHIQAAAIGEAAVYFSSFASEFGRLVAASRIGQCGYLARCYLVIWVFVLLAAVLKPVPPDGGRPGTLDEPRSSAGGRSRNRNG